MSVVAQRGETTGGEGDFLHNDTIRPPGTIFRFVELWWCNVTGGSFIFPPPVVTRGNGGRSSGSAPITRRYLDSSRHKQPHDTSAALYSEKHQGSDPMNFLSLHCFSEDSFTFKLLIILTQGPLCCWCCSQNNYWVEPEFCMYNICVFVLSWRPAHLSLQKHYKDNEVEQFVLTSNWLRKSTNHHTRYQWITRLTIFSSLSQHLYSFEWKNK